MTHIPTKILQDILNDPAYRFCARYGYQKHVCDGRITLEHAIIYAGKQLQEKWAIIPLCAKAHNVDDWQDRGDYIREISVWIALNRRTDEYIESLKSDYLRHSKKWLNAKYGVWKQKYPEVDFLIH